MSLITFLILKNLKALKSDNKPDSEKKNSLLKKTSKKTAKNILRIKSEDKNG